MENKIKELESVLTDVMHNSIIKSFHDLLPTLLSMQEKLAERISEKLIHKFFETESEFLLPYNELRKDALRETIQFIKSNMPDSLIADSPDMLREYAISQRSIDDGLFLEFGVYNGNSINQIAALLPDKTIFGFDSFFGLPEVWAGHRAAAGKFDLKGRLPRVAKNVTLIEGYFDKTVPKFFQYNKKPISFLHCDADLYSSTKTIFEYAGDFIKSGTVIVFDEFFNYPNWKNHEYKAFIEFCEERKITFTYLAFCRFQVALIIT